MNHVVYLIMTESKKVYVGCTQNFKQRRSQHISSILRKHDMDLYVSLSEEEITSIRIFPITGEMKKFDALYAEGCVINIFYQLEGFTVLNKHQKLQYSHIAEGIIEPLILPPEVTFLEYLSRLVSDKYLNEMEAGK